MIKIIKFIKDSFKRLSTITTSLLSFCLPQRCSPIVSLVILAFSIPSQGAALQTLHAVVPVVTARLKPLQHLANSNSLELTIGLNLRDRAGLTNLLREIYDPTSPNYHNYLTPEQFAAKFGP